MNRRSVITLVKYLLAFGLLAGVVWSSWGEPGGNGLGDVWQRHSDGQPLHVGYLLAAIALFAAGQLVSLVRWYVLLRALDLPVTLRASVALGMIGCFFNAFLPGSVGGDVVRAAVLAGEQRRRTAAVTSVVMDRLIAMWSLFSFAALLGGIAWVCGWVTGPAADRSLILIVLAAVASGASGLGWQLIGLMTSAQARQWGDWLEQLPRFGRAVAEIWRTLWQFRCHQRAMAFAALMSWAASAGFVLAFYCAARALASEDGSGVPTPFEHFLIVPIALVVQAGIPLPGGIGAGEWSLGALYQLVGGAKALGILSSLALRVISWGVALCGGIVFIYYGSSKPIHNPSEQTIELTPT